MKFTKIKLTASVILALVGVVTLTNYQANAENATWGPERTTYTWDNPAYEPTFNSMADNPTIGDERNFVRVREYGTGDTYSDNVDIEAGKTYEVYVYYHNNAGGDTNSDGSGIANNVRLRMEAPEAVDAGEAAVIKGIISATNSNPSEVWDTAFLHTDEIVYLRYVDGSAVIHNGGSSNGKVLSDAALWDDQGVFLAYYDNYWGVIPGCNEYAGYVTFQIKVDQPGFYMEKTGKVTGSDNDYSQYISAKPGDTLDFKIRYHNTGTTIQNGVVLYDKLGDGLVSIPGSTYLATPTSEGNESSEGLFGDGLNIGDYASDQQAIATYQVKVEDDMDKFPCGDTVVYNLAGASTANGTIHDKVKITVTRSCEPDTPGTPDELPNTGPLEIIMAIIVIIGIGGAGYYFYRTKKTLKTAENEVTGKDEQIAKESKELEDKTEKTTEGSSQKPSDMV
ncbi:hypothetical protein IKG33_00185 [Candidatus Saccharibacteria bacterium]|nr:hypothetical protein [Candidatus Saccharibacteria bacterium]